MRRGYPTNGGSRNSPINDYAAAASPASPTSPRPSPPGPLTGTRTRNPSSGKPPQPTSSPKSNAGATPSTRSNQRRTTSAHRTEDPPEEQLSRPVDRRVMRLADHLRSPRLIRRDAR